MPIFRRRTRRFEALIDNDSSFEHTRNSQVFNIKDAQTKIEKKKQESLAEIEKMKDDRYAAWYALVTSPSPVNSEE